MKTSISAIAAIVLVAIPASLYVVAGAGPEAPTRPATASPAEQAVALHPIRLVVHHSGDPMDATLTLTSSQGVVLAKRLAHLTDGATETLATSAAPGKYVAKLEAPGLTGTSDLDTARCERGIEAPMETHRGTVLLVLGSYGIKVDKARCYEG